MNELPLHPAIVHLPLGIALTLPLVAAVVWGGVYRFKWPSLTVVLPALLSTVMSVTAYVAMGYGSDDWDKVKKFVPKEALEDHAHNGDRFFYLTVALAVFFIASFLLRNRKAFHWVYGIAFITMLITLAQGLNTGHTGGELIYVHGGASGHILSPTQPQSAPSNPLQPNGGAGTDGQGANGTTP